MSDDLETVDDPLVEMTDDSCTVEFIEIVPIDRTSDDYETPQFIYPVLVLPPDVLQEIKQEPAGDYDIGDPHYHVKQELTDECETKSECFTIQVSFACTESTYLGISSSLKLCMCIPQLKKIT